MLADPEMEVATSVVVGTEARLAFYDRIRRRRQIRRAAYELRHLWRDGVEHDARRGSARDVSVLRGKTGNQVLPSVHQLALDASFELAGNVGVCRPVALVPRLPFGLNALSARTDFPPVVERFRRDVEWLQRGISQCLLRQLHLILTQRRSVGLGSVTLVGAAVTDV